MKLRTLALALLTAVPGALVGAAPPPAHSPYAAEAGADIKALSADEVKMLLEGRGMGFAKAAELNGYPGPLHVLELAEALELRAEQRDSTQALFERMRVAALREGAAYVAAERALDRLFAAKTIDAARLEAALATIETHRGRLRAVHLNAHLEQVRILDAAQVAKYSELRGYSGGTDHSQGHH
jgi:Spy/CpxP family protein refolding chaperone